MHSSESNVTLGTIARPEAHASLIRAHAGKGRRALKIGNAPCSWGVFYPEGNSITAEAYLDAVSRAGYPITELGPLGFLGEDPVWIAEALAARNLTLAGAAHVHTLADPASAPALTATLHRLGRLLSALGSRDLILMDESEFYPVATQGVVDETGWRTAMTLIRQARVVMRDDYGITLHVHPHVGTCLEREAQIDRMLGETEVSLCFDTGHHAFWDQDVLAYMDKVWDRIGMVHLKNVDPVVRARVLAGAVGVNASFDQGVMCALPDGAIDIGAVVRFLVDRRYDGAVIVEQDPPLNSIETPEALARRNLAFLKAALS
jgi:inosose dehydratase